MSKKKMINYLLHDAITDGNNLANIRTPHNKAHLYKEHIDKMLAEELLPSSTIRTKTQKLQKLDNDDIDLLYMGSQEEEGEGVTYTLMKMTLMKTVRHQVMKIMILY